MARIRKAKTLNDVAILRALVLGKKGPLGELLRVLGKLPPSERPKVGEQINLLKARLEHAIAEVQSRLEASAREAQIETSRYDVTLPGRRVVFGARHPLRMVEDEIIAALLPLGFTVAYGPLAEHDWYNFEALNFPPDHPARDTQDTFFLGAQTLLRTHTSNVQIRTMTRQKPPVRVLAPGMVFRHDELDPTHSPVFHQIEGLWVDDHTTFADLKGTLYRFLQTLFGPSTRLRFRPSFFPFTEPSAEVDVSCIVCGGKGCRVCKGSGWLEILGAGMV
ncbi:MAG: phenylalanine--tRNA ligase subunit alpha, partial [Deltaproteobacteria bacterium]|nr:phenylalanine--tRNA ligase subunit alpha [Deltaproteobacteria bacterium]